MASVTETLSGKIVNPKHLTDTDNFDTKAIITAKEQVLLSISRARQKCGYDKKLGRYVSAREIFFDSMLMFSRSVGGKALEYQKDSTIARLRAEDHKETKITQHEEYE